MRVTALGVARISNAVIAPGPSISLGRDRLEQPNNATFRPGSAQGKGKGREYPHHANRFWRAAAPSPRARFARRHRFADRPHAAGAADSGRTDSRAHTRSKSDQYRVGRKDRAGPKLGRQARNVGKTSEAGAGRRFLFAAVDQRTP